MHSFFLFCLLGRNEFALRQGFACGKTLVTRNARRPAGPQWSIRNSEFRSAEFAEHQSLIFYP